jgi:hypothetical protein
MNDRTPAERMRLALDMYEVGERMQRARLRRQDPDATDEQVDALVGAWLRDRPGAEFGDAVGKPSRRFG